ncbi:GH92 family glycosyl hydrolase [Saccharicrinis sp. GN24d3]|uniref:GH92 family glycosyl hydrolase n=1 Tax=Saccharicrinis sp. GN24d3 TaxID=3458416 RepID=UPI0040359776
MHVKNIIIFSTLILGFWACQNRSQRPIDYVDPMIGTDGIGHTFPGATVPFGMVQLSPSNDFKSWNWCSGYHYSDSVLKGFAHTHISGAGLAGLGDILLMPMVGEVKLNPGTEEDPESGYRSRFSHDREKASAGYYSVMLDDYDVHVELTASERVGCHRYTLGKEGRLNVIIDPTHNIMEKVLDTGVEFLSETEFRGYKKCDGEAGERTVYFYAKFSKPVSGYGLAKDDEIITEVFKLNGNNTKAFVQFDLQSDEALEVQVALSFVSYKGAKANYEAEVKGNSFEETLAEAKHKWSEKLNKIHVKGTSESDKRIFYTGMYHSFISPNLVSDVDGKYWLEGKAYPSKIPQYSNYSTWDTYRALNPLFTIIEQGKTAEFVNSLTSRYTETKVGLPVWECLGHDNVCMIGYNAVSPLADAALKDIPGIDKEKVYQAVRAAAMSLEKHSPNYDKNGMAEYIRLGYVPAELNCAVSKTTEQNYYDWCISQLAKKLGNQNDAALFAERSMGYKNLYHPVKKFLYSKYTTGEWREMNPKVWDDLIANYVSGNIWGYSAYVPHDVNGLIELMGGKEVFALWLDDIFADTTQIGGHTHVDISGFIGKYGHGDEPSQHMPYLYNYAGQPWKTQEKVRQVINDFYFDLPDGLVNNDDLGQMSAWYIFSSMGFYPVCPGDMKYIIGSPLFKEVVLNLENGKQFKVKAKNKPKENIYIQSVMLNGQPYTKTYLTHDQIMDGGELICIMGSTPNKDWGTKQGDLPYAKVDLNKNQSALPKITYKPYDKDNSEVFEGSRRIELTCHTSNAKIYYTLDGRTPNKRSGAYKKPIIISKTSNLKAIAYANGMEQSFIYERTYYAGRRFAELEKGFPKITLLNESKKFGDADGSMLLDLEIGSESFNDSRWTGFDGEDMVATIDFGQPISINNVSIGYLSNTGVWIFPPSSVRISVSMDNDNYNTIGYQKLNFSQEEMGKPFLRRQDFQLGRTEARYLKVKVNNFGLVPDWHAAAGHKGWLFVDEILIN